ncbi:MAG: alginate export family protein [Phycisphaerales bacterium]|nr:alginate export family protein [Phycisphaerales bacterium]
MRPNRTIALGVTLALAGWGAAAFAQEGESERRFLQQQRVVDEQLRSEKEAGAPLESLVDLQWGGWLEFYYFNYNDGVQKSRQVSRPSLGLWTRLRLDDGAHELFARMRLTYTYFKPGDEIDRQQDWLGPQFDQVWYQIDVGRAFRLTDPGDPLQLRARLGRQQVVFGTGYVLDLPMDAVLLDGRLGDLRAVGLFGRAVPSYPNIDRSAAVASHSDRLFYGVQLSYEGWQDHVPFVYGLFNNDRSETVGFLQRYSYDSAYLGGGLRGALAHNFNYWAEAALEFGRSFGDRGFLRQDPIEAFAWNVGVEKIFDLPLQPRLSAEYMFASGDGDRRFSPTNARGGNRPGTVDTGFSGFGFRDTGLAFAPTLSNLHVWRAGGALRPFEDVEVLRDFEVGTNWFLYWKNRQRAAISDPLADNFDGYVGWEMDYFLNWRLSSDLSWTLRWGSFFPGDAFSDRGTRHFLFTGVVWSF